MVLFTRLSLSLKIWPKENAGKTTDYLSGKVDVKSSRTSVS